MIGMVVKMMINHFTTEINRILHGKKIISEFEKDGVKKLAHTWYITFHSRQRKVQGKCNSVPV